MPEYSPAGVHVPVEHIRFDLDKRVGLLAAEACPQTIEIEQQFVDFDAGRGQYRTVEGTGGVSCVWVTTATRQADAGKIHAGAEDGSPAVNGVDGDGPAVAILPAGSRGVVGSRICSGICWGRARRERVGRS